MIKYIDYKNKCSYFLDSINYEKKRQPINLNNETI